MYERLPVGAPPGAVVAALREVLRERGITEYAVVDTGMTWRPPAGPPIRRGR